MLEILEKAEKRYAELSEKLSDPKVLTNQNLYRQVAREHHELEEIVRTGTEFRKVLTAIDDDERIKTESADRELVDLAKGELSELYARREALEANLKRLLIPRDPNDKKSVIVEIRAGTGGEEAALFAAELYRMYTKYAERHAWKIDVMNTNPTGLDGLKEVIFGVTGEGAYGKLKYESGVHRVQRVPVTEASGRIHTSAASVAVLPEAEDVEIDIKPDELQIDVFRSSGPGGQSVNTTDSAVRITHKPSGLVVSCQDERSQLKNKIKALKILRARLFDKAQREQKEKIDSARRAMVGSGDRSEKIRTYNYPQNRVTDHRIGLTLHKLEDVLSGELDEFIEGLQTQEQAERLSEAGQIVNEKKAE